MDEPLVKEEPQETYSEADETKDSLQDSDPNLNYSQHTSSLVGGETGTGVGTGSGGTGSYTAQPLRPTNPPQTLEELVALPGASGLQSVSVFASSRFFQYVPLFNVFSAFSHCAEILLSMFLSVFGSFVFSFTFYALIN